MSVVAASSSPAGMRLRALRRRDGRPELLRQLPLFRGLGSRAPIAALSLVIFLFSLTGIPPFAGFAGKYLIFAALVQRGGFWNVLLAVIGVVNSAVSLFYYARIIKAMYLEEAVDERPLAVPAVYTGLLVALAVPVLVLGIYWAPLVRWAAAAFGSGNLS